MAKTKKNCVKGWQCGFGCIAQGLKCRKTESEEVSAETTAISNLISGMITPFSPPTQPTAGLASLPSREEVDAYFAGLEEGEREIQPQNEGIFKSEAGALGMQAYFSADYPRINRYFYDKEYREGEEVTEDIRMKAAAAVRGFEEMPTLSTEELKERYAAKGINYDGKTLYRGMSFGGQEALDDFLAQHDSPDSTVTYQSFTSTTLAKPEEAAGNVDGGWGRKAIQFEIEHKPNTSAKHCDERKKSKDEAELLFAPNTKFEVVKIEKEERERLPDRLREPLQGVWDKEEDGGGVGNLTTKALLGEKSPEALLDDPAFAYFAQFMKKRGLPPMDEWADLPLSKLFNVAKMKGGKFLIMGEMIKALQDQVKEAERTNIKEVSSAKIYLREL